MKRDYRDTAAEWEEAQHQWLLGLRGGYDAPDRDRGTEDNDHRIQNYPEGWTE